MSDEAATLSLKAIIDGIECASEEVQWYANAKTGEVRCFVYSYDSEIDDEEDDFEGDGWLSLPDRYERDDWRMMRDFAYALGGTTGDELLDAIHGNGAFRNFRRSVERMGALQSWYAYKDQRLFELATEWLTANGLAWTDDRHENAKRDWHDLLPAALRMRLALSVLDVKLSVCKLEEVPEGFLPEGFFCIMRTGEEVSLVCETAKTPSNVVVREDDWRALKVQGPLDFGLVGILAKVSSALAEADVPLFALSTYDTDYILVKEERLGAAIAALREDGCDIAEAD